MDAILQLGPMLPLDLGTLTDESSMLLESMNFSAERDETLHKGGAGAVKAAEYRNPRMVIDFNATVISNGGMWLQEPGTTVAALANFASTRHGFDPSDGTLVLTDPKDALTNTKTAAMTGKVTQWPFLTT